MPRDMQRTKFYRVCWAMPNGTVRTIDNAELQGWVDKVMGMRAVQARWGRWDIEVTLKRGGRGLAHGSGRISLPLFARNPTMILHEVAHCLTPSRYAPHGPEYVGVWLFLLKTVDRDLYDKARPLLKKHKVRYNNAAVPKPDPNRVVTKAQTAARKRAAAAKPVGRMQRADAADVIRRLAKQGHFGPSGSKPRRHALDTARALEK